MLERGIRPGVKAWVAEDDGTAIGALVVARICADRWLAYPVLLDLAGAEPVAELLDRSPAYMACGPGEHIQPLASHTSRIRGLLSSHYVAAGRTDAFTSAGDRLVDVDRARLATRDDLEDLVEIFRTFELDNIPTVPRLRRYLRECFDLGRPTVVVEVEGRIVGALRLGPQTDRFFYFGAQTVLPEHRGRGLSNALITRAASTVLEHGTGILGVQSGFNPIPWRDEIDPQRYTKVADATLFEEFDVATGDWVQLWLKPRSRIRGMARVRKLIERIEGPVDRRRPPASYPEERAVG